MQEDNFLRNFSIIAHIDHGKSTLADRLLEYTHAISLRDLKEQTLDTMELERERGITIKAHTITLQYRARDGKYYTLNLIDTPGHVDFSYEVSRALAACEGTLLLVDAAQGVEAQTIANLYLARERNLHIIPVINKIDLPLANPARVRAQLAELGIDTNAGQALLTSARNGTGTSEILEAIVTRVPPPNAKTDAPLKALIFDSVYDQHRGVVGYIRVFDGIMKPGMKLLVMSSGKQMRLDEVGLLRLGRVPRGHLQAGEVGYFIANVKEVSDIRIGDTITDAAQNTTSPFPGYRQPKPVVFSGMYPADGERFLRLKGALEKLLLNDPSFVVEPENSPVLGPGYRCGFLGLLHKEIVQERLEREFDLDLVTTAPTVVYHVLEKSGEIMEVDNPTRFPTNRKVELVEEPYIKTRIITQQQYMGSVLELLEKRRARLIDMKWLDTDRVLLSHKVPLAEVVARFYDELKSISRGYATFDYEHAGYEEADLEKLTVIVHNKNLDALSVIVHKDNAYRKARFLAKRLKSLIPRHQFAVPIQVAIGSKIIARETIPALRKDVTAPLYGGDVTRKRKLLEQQKRGKKRMKRFGSVSIPQEALMAALEVE
jgi:GTP-binding protein LepA